jgi:xanthine dehydrogenase YagS FAD-binding subunit
MPRGAHDMTALLFADAHPTPQNAFKLKLAERTLGAVLNEARG